MSSEFELPSFVNSLSDPGSEFRIEDLVNLLESKHQNLDRIFEVLRMNRQHYPAAQKVLQSILLNVYKMTSFKLEQHIIRNVWKSSFVWLLICENLGESIKMQQGSLEIQKKIANSEVAFDILTFLCQKMRSLTFEVRIQAVRSFNRLIVEIMSVEKSGKSTVDLGCFEALVFKKAILAIASLMIRKEQLIKAVSYPQGLFLQLLEDEFHEVRLAALQAIQTLVVIENVNNYFFSDSSEGVGQVTAKLLKQVVLYMVNDESEDVREKTLSIIINICRHQSQKFEINNDRIRIFDDIQDEELKTVLMCLKEKKSILRHGTYETLSVIPIKKISQLLFVLERLNQSLLTYKEDKARIYSLLRTFSTKYKSTICAFMDQNPQKNIPTFFNYHNQELPACKNLVYKGKLILLKEIISDSVAPSGKSQSLKYKWPYYIREHLSYVEGIENKRQFLERVRDYEGIYVQSETLNDHVSMCATKLIVGKNVTGKQQMQRFEYKKIKQFINDEISQSQGFKRQFLLLIVELIELVFSDTAQTQLADHFDIDLENFWETQTKRDLYLQKIGNQEKNCFDAKSRINIGNELFKRLITLRILFNVPQNLDINKMSSTVLTQERIELQTDQVKALMEVTLFLNQVEKALSQFLRNAKQTEASLSQNLNTEQFTKINTKLNDRILMLLSSVIVADNDQLLPNQLILRSLLQVNFDLKRNSCSIRPITNQQGVIQKLQIIIKTSLSKRLEALYPQIKVQSTRSNKYLDNLWAELTVFQTTLNASVHKTQSFELKRETENIFFAINDLKNIEIDGLTPLQEKDAGCLIGLNLRMMLEKLGNQESDQNPSGSFSQSTSPYQSLSQVQKMNTEKLNHNIKCQRSLKAVSVYLNIDGMRTKLAEWHA